MLFTRHILTLLDTGPLPPGICNLTSLRELVIKYTHVSGTIPWCISKLKELTHLDLSRNGYAKHGGFSGEAKGAFIVAMALRNRMCSGPLPHTITMLTKLRYLDLSYNNFDVGSYAQSGAIHEWLSSIPEAQVSQKQLY